MAALMALNNNEIQKHKSLPYCLNQLTRRIWLLKRRMWGRSHATLSLMANKVNTTITITLMVNRYRLTMHNRFKMTSGNLRKKRRVKIHHAVSNKTPWSSHHKQLATTHSLANHLKPRTKPALFSTALNTCKVSSQQLPQNLPRPRVTTFQRTSHLLRLPTISPKTSRHSLKTKKM